MKGFVYILLLGDGRYYVGSTNNIERRLEDHQQSRVVATRTFLPVELRFYRKYETLTQARHIESHLKQQKRRDIIEKFMSDTWLDLW